jgi:hypothetical protein
VLSRCNKSKIKGSGVCQNRQIGTVVVPIVSHFHLSNPGNPKTQLFSMINLKVIYEHCIFTDDTCEIRDDASPSSAESAALQADGRAEPGLLTGSTRLPPG